MNLMEEEIDYYEKLENAKKDYEKESEYLLQTIAKREEMVGLLKIAKPDKIKDIQDVVQRLDSSINQTERIMEHICKQIDLLEKAIKHAEELEIKLDFVQKEFLEYIKREKPEKLEEVEAMILEDGTSH